ETLLPIIPIAFVALFIPLVFRRILSPSRLWSRQYHLQRPFTVDIDESSIRITEPLAATECKWQYSRGYNQTPNLFLLYPSALTFVMIPKRAFPNPQAL